MKRNKLWCSRKDRTNAYMRSYRNKKKMFAGFATKIQRDKEYENISEKYCSESLKAFSEKSNSSSSSSKSLNPEISSSSIKRNFLKNMKTLC